MKRVAFATCVQLGLSCIQAIYEINGKLELLITLTDEQAQNKSGRIYLDGLAQQHDLPLLKIKNINEATVINALRAKKIDWLFIIGWSQIAKTELLNTPTYGCIGMHPTLLPQGRGRAVIPWAILKGLDQTGVTMFKLDEGVDTGPIIGQEIIHLVPDETAATLYEKADQAHISLIKRYWPAIVQNKITLTPQDESQATEWLGRKPEDGEITSAMTMQEADRMVRAVTHPYPGAFYRVNEEKTLRIWSAQTTESPESITLRDGYLTPIEFEVEEKHHG